MPANGRRDLIRRLKVTLSLSLENKQWRVLIIAELQLLAFLIRLLLFTVFLFLMHYTTSMCAASLKNPVTENYKYRLEWRARC